MHEPDSSRRAAAPGPDTLTTALSDGLLAVATPGDERYEALATPWNVAVQSRPLAVVDAADAGEVATAVRIAGEHGATVSVQCTGHGAGVDVSTSVMVSTRRLDECVVHPEGWARIGAGVAWQQVLDAAAPHGFAPLAGSSPGVGVVGYVTGGGHGPLARTFGLCSDRARAFEVVTGDGRLLRTTPEEHADLFWGLRGGKGALGIVTAVELDLLPIAQLYGGALYFDGADAAAVTRAWASWCRELPSEATTSLALFQLPAMPGVPEFLAGRLTVGVRFAWAGSEEAGRDALAPIRTVATPLIDAVAMMPYAALGAIHADPVDPMPIHESHALLRELPEAAVDALLAVAGEGSGSPQILVEVRQLGGAVQQEPVVPGAFCGREAAYSLLGVGIAAPPVGDAVRAHGTALLQAMAPWSLDGALPNFLPVDDAAGYRRLYTPAVLDRLRAASEAYDPAGVLLAARGLRDR